MPQWYFILRNNQSKKIRTHLNQPWEHLHHLGGVVYFVRNIDGWKKNWHCIKSGSQMIVVYCRSTIQYNIAEWSPPLHCTPPVLSTCPLHTNSGCGKERHILIGPWRPAKAALVRNYLEVYWPCAGGLSAVNTIGMQLRDPTNSGLTRWCMAVFI